MTASALTAVSATALLSFLGLWGTVFGMGLLSVLTVLGNYLYQTSIQRTAEKVKQVRPAAPRPPTVQRTPTAERTSLPSGWHAAAPSRVTDTGRRAVEPSGTSDAGEGTMGRLRAVWASMVERYGLRRIVLSIVAVFVVLAGTITMIELAAGKPMSDIVRNDSGNGTSVFDRGSSRGTGNDGPTGEDADREERQPQESGSEPTEQPTEDPQESESEPTEESPESESEPTEEFQERQGDSGESPAEEEPVPE